MIKKEIEKLVNDLRKPENARKLKRIFAVFCVAVFGLYFSMSLISSGLELVIESGVPESTIKAIMGIVASITGFALFFWSIIRPADTLYKIVFE